MLFLIRRKEFPALVGLVILAGCGQAAPPAETAAIADAESPAIVADASPEDVTPAAPAEAAETAKADDHDHAHDHDDDHDTAGGTAHVHGVADLAITLTGNEISAQMISPLANFGLPEADGAFTPEVIAGLPGLIELTGGACNASAPVAVIDTSSGHTDADISFSWACGNADAVTAIRFAGFASFPGFEKINAVYIGEGIQKAGELTPSKSELSLK